MNPRPDFELQVDNALLDAGVTVGFVLFPGIGNDLNVPAFYADRDDRLRSILEAHSLASLRADPYLRGYHDLHAHFGIANPALVPSPESLFEALFRYRELRPINPLVDIYNIVALERRLSCGAHALDRLDGGIRLAIVDGSETFVPLGSRKATAVPAGEYAYIDGANRIVCRRECRQGAHSAVTDETRDAVIIVQGNRAVPAGAIERACSEIIDHVKRYLRPDGEVRQCVIGPPSPARTVTGAAA